MDPIPGQGKHAEANQKKNERKRQRKEEEELEEKALMDRLNDTEICGPNSAVEIKPVLELRYGMFATKHIQAGSPFFAETPLQQLMTFSRWSWHSSNSIQISTNSSLSH